MVTAIRPDPMVQGANVVEIKPDANANVRITVSLVQSDEANAGVTSRVTAGMTERTVADSAKVLTPSSPHTPLMRATTSRSRSRA